jgi:two-component system, LuxR family, response regulator FixJ
MRNWAPCDMELHDQNNTDLLPPREPLESLSARANAPPEERPTVFVVDDDVNICSMLCLLMKAAGLDVETFLSAQQFLDAFDPDRPGCLLLDVYMAGINGIELQRRLAAEKLGPAIIFLTGYGDVPMASQAIRTGAVDFIQKPFVEQILVNRIYEAIARDREIRRAHRRLLKIEKRVCMLTPREREVMDLIASGQSTKKIALQLKVSPKTIDSHRAKIFEKMDVENPIELSHLLLGHGQN